jgi:hypothetical protein
LSDDSTLTAGYSVSNALFQWEEGERRVREAADPARRDLERAASQVFEELRRRLGSSFSVEELAALYAADVDWGFDLAARAGAGSDAAWVVDAAFGSYAREATNFAGGRPRDDSERF